jgi:hypothetical protein
MARLPVLYTHKKSSNRCWKGYKPTPGKKAYSEGSCTKDTSKKDSKSKDNKKK